MISVANDVQESSLRALPGSFDVKFFSKLETEHAATGMTRPGDLVITPEGVFYWCPNSGTSHAGGFEIVAIRGLPRVFDATNIAPPSASLLSNISLVSISGNTCGSD